MDERIKRFKQCEPRFYPYLKKVLERLPADVRERVLTDTELQIIADEDLNELCVLRYTFDHPVKNIIYLNTKVLKEPEHQLVHTIAHELALYIIGEGETDEAQKRAEALLSKWGFEKEIEAVRYDKAIAESDGYQTGYSWAKNRARTICSHILDFTSMSGTRKDSRECLDNNLKNFNHELLGRFSRKWPGVKRRIRVKPRFAEMKR